MDGFGNPIAFTLCVLLADEILKEVLDLAKYSLWVFWFVLLFQHQCLHTAGIYSLLRKRWDLS